MLEQSSTTNWTVSCFVLAKKKDKKEKADQILSLYVNSI